MAARRVSFLAMLLFSAVLVSAGKPKLRRIAATHTPKTQSHGTRKKAPMDDTIEPNKGGAAVPPPQQTAAHVAPVVGPPHQFPASEPSIAAPNGVPPE
jgi:hypothetical protein